MSRWRNNGGWNKRNGQAEKTPRIDSYEVAEVGSCGTLFAYADGGIPLVLDCCHNTGCAPDGEWENLEVWDSKTGWSQTLELSRKENGFGGNQTFFLCPSCGRRVRYLYLCRGMFSCRDCIGLNYRSQQETKSDCMYFYNKGMDLVEKHLEPPPFFIDGFEFCRWIPDRPRYMHQTTYRRYLRRFAKYQDQHQRRQLEDMARILRLFK